MISLSAIGLTGNKAGFPIDKFCGDEVTGFIDVEPSPGNPSITLRSN